MKKYCESCNKFFGMKSNFCPVCGRQLIDKEKYDISKEFEPILEGTLFKLERNYNSCFRLSFKSTGFFSGDEYRKRKYKDSQTIFERLVKKSKEFAFKISSSNPFSIEINISSLKEDIDFYDFISIPITRKNIKLVQKYCTNMRPSQILEILININEDSISSKQRMILEYEDDLKKLSKIKNILDKLK